MRNQMVRQILFVVGVTLIVSVNCGASAGETVKVPLDVDVYAQPGGVGKPVEQLKAGSKVIFLGGRKDHWCQVGGEAVPGGKGWVWCGVGDDGRNYDLIVTDPETQKTPLPVTQSPIRSFLCTAGVNPNPPGRLNATIAAKTQAEAEGKFAQLITDANLVAATPVACLGQ